jgi:tetratricopeptide (TPR) repeat protein
MPVWAGRRLKANPKDSHVLRVRSSAFADERRFDEALKDLTAVLKLDPTDSASQNRRGWVRMMIDEFDGAIQDFNEALRLDPSAEFAIANRGYCRLMLKEHAKADADLSEWLKTSPKDPEWLGYRAHARFHLQEWEKCLADAETVLKADPKRSDVVPFKAAALEKLKRYQEALDCFEKGIEDDPTDRLYVACARFLSTCPEEKFRDAVRAVRLMKLTRETYEQAKREMPAEYLEVFAAAYAEGGEFDEAIEKQKEAIDRLKADKKAPAAELKRAEAVLELYKKSKPLRDE